MIYDIRGYKVVMQLASHICSSVDLLLYLQWKFSKHNILIIIKYYFITTNLCLSIFISGQWYLTIEPRQAAGLRITGVVIVTTLTIPHIISKTPEVTSIKLIHNNIAVRVKQFRLILCIVYCGIAILCDWPGPAKIGHMYICTLKNWLVFNFNLPRL